MALMHYTRPMDTNTCCFSRINGDTAHSDNCPNKPAPLAPWERELLFGRDLIATVTFTRLDGVEVSFENVNVDSIGPSAENPGVIGVEFEDDIYSRIVHVPFVKFWTIDYK